VGMGLVAPPRAKALGNGGAEPLAQRFEIRFLWLLCDLRDGVGHIGPVTSTNQNGGRTTPLGQRPCFTLSLGHFLP
jgi:hypothetical protein